MTDTIPNGMTTFHKVSRIEEPTTYRIEMIMDGRYVPMPNEQIMESEAKAIFFAQCFERRNPNRIFAVIENGTDRMVYPIHY